MLKNNLELSPKKTISSWLTTKYLLIVRNEENFAEKSTYTFNYARLILIGLLVFILALTLAIFLVTGALQQRLDPRYSQQETRRQLIEMRLGMDSMQYQILNKDIYIQNIQNILSGELTGNDFDSLSSARIQNDVVITDEIEPIDSIFRAEFENTLIANKLTWPGLV